MAIGQRGTPPRGQKSLVLVPVLIFAPKEKDKRIDNENGYENEQKQGATQPGPDANRIAFQLCQKSPQTTPTR